MQYLKHEANFQKYPSNMDTFVGDMFLPNRSVKKLKAETIVIFIITFIEKSYIIYRSPYSNT